jgi:hypothetical protein
MKYTPFVSGLLVLHAVLGRQFDLCNKYYSLHPDFISIIHKSYNPKIPPPPRHISI